MGSSRPLRDHDRGQMGVRRRDVRHYRRIDDPQAGCAVDSASRIDDSSGRGVDPHRAGADRMVVCPCLAPHPRSQFSYGCVARLRGGAASAPTPSPVRSLSWASHIIAGGAAPSCSTGAARPVRPAQS
jgi:hypothetical protein